MTSAGRDSRTGAFAALGLVGQLGLVVVVCVLAGVAGGSWLDRIVGGRGLVLAGSILLGVFAGLYGAYRLIVRGL